MKARRIPETPPKPRFKPITIEIVMESKKEAETLYGLFNHSGICDGLRNHGVEPEEIRRAIDKDETIGYSDFHSFISKHWKN